MQSPVDRFVATMTTSAASTPKLSFTMTPMETRPRHTPGRVGSFACHTDAPSGHQACTSRSGEGWRAVKKPKKTPKPFGIEFLVELSPVETQAINGGRHHHK